jgi:preprotein translocase subunit YajC
MKLFPLLLDGTPADAPAAASSGGGLTQMVVMIVAFLALFWLIIFRPEQKRRKEEEAKRGALKKGDHVTTVAGIVGVCMKVNPDTVVVRMVDGNRIEFLKAAISDVKPATEEEARKIEKEE